MIDNDSIRVNQSKVFENVDWIRIPTMQMSVLEGEMNLNNHKQNIKWS